MAFIRDAFGKVVYVYSQGYGLPALMTGALREAKAFVAGKSSTSFPMVKLLELTNMELQYQQICYIFQQHNRKFWFWSCLFLYSVASTGETFPFC